MTVMKVDSAAPGELLYRPLNDLAAVWRSGGRTGLTEIRNCQQSVPENDRAART